MKKFCVFLLLILVAAAGAGFYGYQRVQQFLAQPVNVQPDQLLTLERGTTGNKLAALLEQQKLIDDAQILPWLLKLQPQLNKIKAGTYSLAEVKTVQDLLDLLNSGKELQLAIRIGEGESFEQWQKNLQNAPLLKHQISLPAEQQTGYQAFMQASYRALDWAKINPLVAEDKNANAQQNLNGLLYPDTYHYTPNSSDIELLERAAKKMAQALEKAWNERDQALPLNSPYEMLVLASIVEKESGIAAERGKIASVFINRLNKKMKLQTDPTVIYGMGEAYNGNIRKKDLETPTAYNTYVIDGLPPTPISMVSESALQAVAHPESSDFLYFVADGSGGHKFSRNLNEHQQAVQQYLRWYREQKNKAK